MVSAFPGRTFDRVAPMVDEFGVTLEQVSGSAAPPSRGSSESPADDGAAVVLRNGAASSGGSAGWTASVPLARMFHPGGWATSSSSRSSASSSSSPASSAVWPSATTWPMGRNTTAPLIGITLGALVTYLAGGIVGRFLDRGVAGAVHELRSMPASEVFAGSVVGTTGLLAGLVAGLPLVALVHSTRRLPGRGRPGLGAVRGRDPARVSPRAARSSGRPASPISSSGPMIPRRTPPSSSTAPPSWTAISSSSAGPVCWPGASSSPASSSTRSGPWPRAPIPSRHAGPAAASRPSIRSGPAESTCG